MARTYKTLSLSLHPDVVERLRTLGRERGLSAARVAARMVIQEVHKVFITKPLGCISCNEQWKPKDDHQLQLVKYDCERFGCSCACHSS